MYCSNDTAIRSLRRSGSPPCSGWQPTTVACDGRTARDRPHRPIPPFGRATIHTNDAGLRRRELTLPAPVHRIDRPDLPVDRPQRPGPVNAGHRSPVSRSLAALVLSSLVWAPTSPALAQLVVPGDQLRLTYGPWAYHFNPSDEHVDYNHLVAVEFLTSRWTFLGAERSQIGFALFDNSFGQFSQYLYVGQEWDLLPLGPGQLFANVTAGLLHGYKEPYQDKIPFNGAGVAPVIIPSLGWRYRRFAVTATVLGTNGFLFGASWHFDLNR